MSRRQVRADALLVERLRQRQVSWDDRQDEAVAGLLALARDADRLAPAASAAPIAARTPRPRAARPALAGLATTALAGVAVVLSGLTGGSTPTPTPTPTPTTSTDVAVVSQLLDQVKADLAEAAKAPVAAKPALLQHAATTLKAAERRTTGLAPKQRADLRKPTAALRTQIAAGTPPAQPQAQPGNQPQPQQTRRSTPKGTPHDEGRQPVTP